MYEDPHQPRKRSDILDDLSNHVGGNDRLLIEVLLDIRDKLEDIYMYIPDGDDVVKAFNNDKIAKYKSGTYDRELGHL